MARRIGVDVDLVIADSDVSHWDWLDKIGTKNSRFDFEGGWDYDLGKYFDLPDGVDSMDYWRLSDIYDEKPCETPLTVVHQVYTRPVQPIQDSQKVLSKLKEMGWEILFISHVKGNHHKSKVEWLKRHFPFMDGFVATKEKYYVNSCCDVFVDDRNKHLNRSEATFNIKFDTPYLQEVELEKNTVDFTTGNWIDIENWILNRIF